MKGSSSETRCAVVSVDSKLITELCQVIHALEDITDIQAPPSLITRNIPSKMTLSYLSVYQFQQCRLPGSVGSHQRHSCLQVNPKVKVPVYPWSLRGIAEANTLYHDHRGRDLTAVWE